MECKFGLTHEADLAMSTSLIASRAYFLLKDNFFMKSESVHLLFEETETNILK